MMKDAIAALCAIGLLVCLSFLATPSFSGQGVFRSTESYYSEPGLVFGSIVPDEQPVPRRQMQPIEMPTDFARHTPPTPSRFADNSPIHKPAPLYLNAYDHCVNEVDSIYDLCKQDYILRSENCPTQSTCAGIEHSFFTCQRIYYVSLGNCKRLYVPVAHNTSYIFG